MVDGAITRRALGLAAAAACLPVGAQASTGFPQRRVTLIVAGPTGSALDAVARYLSTKLADTWQVPVVVDNRVGGDGIVGTMAAKTAAADGLTILMAAPPFVFAPELVDKPPYDALRDFRPVVKISRAFYMLAASNSAPFTTFAEMVAYSKRQPLDVGTIGGYSASAATMLGRAAGAQIVIAPYKTTGQSISDAMGGHIPLVIAPVGTLAPLTKAGSLKALVTSGTSRAQVTPDVPTAAEAGATGYQAVSWNGAFVRAGTPDAAIEAIAQAMRQATQGADFAAFCRQQGLEADFVGPQAWAEQVPKLREQALHFLRESGALKARE